MTDADAPGLPRVLIPITISFAVRYVVRTGLAERLRATCVPVLALSWDDPSLAGELGAAGFEVARLPDARVSAAVHSQIAHLEAAFTRRLRSPSTRIDRTRRHVDRPASIRLRRWARWEETQLRARFPGDEARARRELAALLPTETNLDENRAFLAEQRIDAVFSVTPFAIQELVLLHAAEQAGLPAITSILSFDNITTRPPLPILFDRYLVWNRFNEDEIHRGYPAATTDRVTVVGPGQFDFYADPSLVEEAASWRSRLGVAAGAPTVLYGAGPPSVSPHEDQYVDDLVAAVHAGTLPADLRIVLRRHPTDNPGRWDRFEEEPVVAFDDPGAVGARPIRPGQVDLGREQIIHLCSSLAHTDVHVSVSSTMTLDGAFFDKPQLGPAYDRRGGARQRRRARDLYRREHFVPIVASGGLELSSSPAELVDQVRAGLERPGDRHRQRRAMLEALCTYTDGKAIERVAREVGRFVNPAGA